MRLGIDLGGTKIEAVVLSDAGEIVIRERVATPRGSYADIVDAVASLCVRVEQQSGTECSVGCGIPGIISPATGLVKNANTTELIGHPLKSDLESRLNREVRIANDANCFALSEALDGAASAAQLGLSTTPEIVFGVILGTGTGGGVVHRGELLTGADSIAGEWGHNPLPWPTAQEFPGLSCWCGLKGCIETYLSGPGLEKDHLKTFGTQLNAVQIATLAERGDPHAQQTLERYEGRLARALAAVINLLNPDAIVLGGGVSNITRLYTSVPAQWKRFVFSDVVTTRLVRARHGDSSGVRGAAWLWPRTE